jgi:hypothetical protein
MSCPVHKEDIVKAIMLKLNNEEQGNELNKKD